MPLIVAAFSLFAALTGELNTAMANAKYTKHVGYIIVNKVWSKQQLKMCAFSDRLRTPTTNQWIASGDTSLFFVLVNVLRQQMVELSINELNFHCQLCHHTVWFHGAWLVGISRFEFQGAIGVVS